MHIMRALFSVPLSGHRAPWSADCILQDLITRLKACAKKRPAPKAAAEPAAKRGARLEDAEGLPETHRNIKMHKNATKAPTCCPGMSWSLTMTSWVTQHHTQSISKRQTGSRGFAGKHTHFINSHSSRWQAKLRRVPRCDSVWQSKVHLYTYRLRLKVLKAWNWRWFLATPLQRFLSALRQKQRAERSLKRHLTSWHYVVESFLRVHVPRWDSICLAFNLKLLAKCSALQFNQFTIN